MKIVRNRKAITKLGFGIVMTIILVAAAFSSLYAYKEGWFNAPATSPPATTPPPGTPPPASVATGYSAKAQWQIRDKLTRIATASGDAGYISISRAQNGVFDLLNAVEETEYDAAPDTSAGTYTSGDKLILAVSSDNDPTGGYETYPRWFYIDSLNHGSKVLAFPLLNPISALIGQVDSTGNYKYTVNTAVLEDVGQNVVWLAGTTPYWDIGTFELYGRVAKDYMIQQVTNKGVVGATLNDGAGWIDTDAEISANFTFTSDSEDLYFELVGEAADVAFGLPTLAVSSTGMVKQYNAVLIFTTDATSMTSQTLLDDGWKIMDKVGLTADLAFYYVIDPVRDKCIPGNGGIINLKVPLTISDSGLVASTEYEFEGWVLDYQNVEDIARGTVTTSLPTVNGFLTEYGSDTVVQPLALTVSSGSAATPQMMGHFTTNA